MNVPSMNDASEFGSSNVPNKGHQDVSLKNMEADKSKAGNDMLVATLVIDNGPDARLEMTEYLTMGTEYGIGEDRLFSMCKNTRTHELPEGYEWDEDVDSWDEFAAQFVRETPMRFGVEIDHEFSIETERGWKNDVEREKYEAHVEDGGKGRISAEIVDYREPRAKSEVPNLSPGQAEEPSEENGFPEYEGDGAPADAEAESEGADDGFPF